MSSVLRIASSRCAEGREHLARILHVELVGAEAPALLVVERLAGLDAEQHVVGDVILRMEVVAVVGRHQRQAELVGQRDQLTVGALLLLQVVVLDLDVVAVAEDLAVLHQHVAGAIHRAGHQRLIDLARQAAGQCDQPAVEFAQQRLVDARLVVEALRVAEGHQAAEVAVPFLVGRQQDEMEIAGGLEVVAPDDPLLVPPIAWRDVHLAADDRLHPMRDARLVELDGAEHVAVVGHRDRRHAELLHARHELRDLVGPVEQRVLGVEVEVSEAHGGQKGVTGDR